MWLINTHIRPACMVWWGEIGQPSGERDIYLCVGKGPFGLRHVFIPGVRDHCEARNSLESVIHYKAQSIIRLSQSQNLSVSCEGSYG